MLIQVRPLPPAVLLPRPRQVSKSIFQRSVLMGFDDIIRIYIVITFLIKNMKKHIIEKYVPLLVSSKHRYQILDRKVSSSLRFSSILTKCTCFPVGTTSSTSSTSKTTSSTSTTSMSLGIAGIAD